MATSRSGRQSKGEASSSSPPSVEHAESGSPHADIHLNPQAEEPRSARQGGNGGEWGRGGRGGGGGGGCHEGTILGGGGRRLRRSALIRQAVADVTLSPDRLIYPLFVSSEKEARPVSSMPGISQLPVKAALKEIRQLQRRGLTQFLLFGVTPEHRKDACGSFAAHPDAPVNRLLASVRDAGLDVLMYADLCLCEYTDHGHCGLLPQDAKMRRAGIVENSATLKQLAITAIAQANAGADIVAPSAMMDGQVAAIRQALDQSNHDQTAILSYSVKYASSFYGPFRDAGQGGMKFGDRRSYQMDYRRQYEWRRELQADIEQGADMVMVKPAATYLDIVRQVRDACDLPVVAYHVSGEFAMLHAAARQGWLDLRSTVLETTFGIRRAGADLVVTYFAPMLTPP